jgi:hypothetical protein
MREVRRDTGAEFIEPRTESLGSTRANPARLALNIDPDQYYARWQGCDACLIGCNGQYRDISAAKLAGVSARGRIMTACAWAYQLAGVSSSP